MEGMGGMMAGMGGHVMYGRPERPRPTSRSR